MTRSERAAQLWSVLALAATNRQILTYDTVAKLTGLPRQRLASFLDPIQYYCQQQHLPPLTVLVVSNDSGLPGKGFIGAADIPRAQADVFKHDWLAQGAPKPEALDAAPAFASVPPDAVDRAPEAFDVHAPSPEVPIISQPKMTEPEMTTAQPVGPEVASLSELAARLLQQPETLEPAPGYATDTLDAAESIPEITETPAAAIEVQITQHHQVSEPETSTPEPAGQDDVTLSELAARLFQEPEALEAVPACYIASLDAAESRPEVPVPPATAHESKVTHHHPVPEPENVTPQPAGQGDVNLSELAARLFLDTEAQRAAPIHDTSTESLPQASEAPAPANESRVIHHHALTEPETAPQPAALEDASLSELAARLFLEPGAQETTSPQETASLDEAERFLQRFESAATPDEGPAPIPPKMKEPKTITPQPPGQDDVNLSELAARLFQGPEAREAAPTYDSAAERLPQTSEAPAIAVESQVTHHHGLAQPETTSPQSAPEDNSLSELAAELLKQMEGTHH